MVSLNPVAFAFILLACAVIALVIGYFLGSRFGGKRSVAMREAEQRHGSYKSDVREHFEQTSAIMSRMVDDYRDLYRHMADGAQQLADIQPERRVTPPPAPEAITAQDKEAPRAATADDEAVKASAANQAETPAAQTPGAGQSDAADKSRTQAGRAAPNRDTVMNSDSANDRPWNKEKGATPAGLK